jgi:predicted DNA-binding transcriptional regulator AlpA
MNYPPPWMDLATLAEHLCMSGSTVIRRCKDGELPAPRKIGRKLFWNWQQVERHLAGDKPAVRRSEHDVIKGIKNAARARIASIR